MDNNKTLERLKKHLEQPTYSMRSVCFILSQDSNVIKYILDMLNDERNESQELINDLALNASKSNMLIFDTKKTAKNSIPREPFIKETFKIFKKWSHRVSHFAKGTEWARKNNLDL